MHSIPAVDDSASMRQMGSSESSAQMKQAGRAAGATGRLVKPFEPTQQIEVIGKVIR